MEPYLNSNCSCADLTPDPNCKQIAKKGPANRWYITFGHAGYNSPANNRDGYSSRDAALKANRTYRNRGLSRK